MPNAEIPEKTIAQIRACRCSGGLNPKNTTYEYVNRKNVNGFTYKFINRFSDDQSSSSKLGITSKGIDSKLL